MNIIKQQGKNIAVKNINTNSNKKPRGGWKFGENLDLLVPV